MLFASSNVFDDWYQIWICCFGWLLFFDVNFFDVFLLNLLYYHQNVDSNEWPVSQNDAYKQIFLDVGSFTIDHEFMFTF